MFKLASVTSSYTWPVKVEIPADGGKVAVFDFDAEFKRLPQSRIDEILNAQREGEMDDKELAREVMTGWKGVTGDDGQELPFSQSALDQALDIQGVRLAIGKAWYESLAGARRKN